MTRHLELIVHTLLSLVGGWIFALGMALLFAVLVAAFLGLNLFKFDRDSFRVALDGVARVFRNGWAWALGLGVLMIQIFGLSTLQQSVSEHLSEQSQAQYRQANDAGGGPTVQHAPTLAFLETTERTQRIVLPPNVLNVVQTNGLNALPGWSPEEARYDMRPAVNVEDTAEKDGTVTVIQRKTTVQRFVPFKLTHSDVTVNLAFQDPHLGQRRQFYHAVFNARYSFTNPFTDKKRLHFTFPLPENSGTLEGFRFRVNGKELPPQDISQGVEYEEDIAPGATNVVEVSYANLGAQSWTYDVAGRREAIADFHLQVQADKTDVKFLRGSLYPSQLNTTNEGLKMSWDLQNQVTSQNISLYFSSVSHDELVRRLYVACPLALVALVTLVLSWSTLRRTRTGPWSMVLATAAWCVGAALTAYLLDSLSLAAAITVGFGCASVLQLLILGPRLWPPIVAAAIVPFTFLSVGNTGLLLSILSMATLAATAWETKRSQ